MLKRKQILIPMWMEKYVKSRAAVSGQSEGELIRGLACLGILHLMALAEIDPPEDIDTRARKIALAIKEGVAPDPVETKRFLDDLYFETRKLTESVSS